MVDATSSPVRSGISVSAKTVLALFAVLGLLAFVVIAELGINAGRVHYGVSVGSVQLGGMTQIDAAKALDKAKGDDALKARMKSTPVILTRGDLKLSVVPSRVGWVASPNATADRAMQVGRQGIWSSTTQRLHAYLGGVTVPWAGAPSSTKVGFLLNHWASKIRQAGFTFTQKDRAHLRYKLKRSMSAWPRTIIRIPVSGS
jgi:hypothetical protein